MAIRFSPPPQPEPGREVESAMIFLDDAQALRIAASLRLHVKYRRKHPTRMRAMGGKSVH